jgi:DNA repair exonuclease SbcCD ATPase subunit
MTNDEKIEKIQLELKQFSQKQVELEKTHQQQFFLYRWLQGPDPELQAVISKIEDLKEDKRRLYDILQASASIPPSVPEVDWS